MKSALSVFTKMGHEIEAKIRVDSLEAIKQTLKSLGVDCRHEIRQEDAYFMDAAGLLAKNDCGLRIRRQWIDGQHSACVTFKGAKVGGPYKSRPEFETGVDNAGMIERIFESLGYEKQITVEKKRTVWDLDDCEVCLDNVSLLGSFVEVEGPDEAAISGVLKKLNLQHQPVIKQGYAAMTAALKQETR